MKSEKRLQVLVGNVIREKTDDLLKRQTIKLPSIWEPEFKFGGIGYAREAMKRQSGTFPSIALSKPEVVNFGRHCDACVSAAIGELTAELAGAVAWHRRLRKPQLRWVLNKVLEFRQGKTSVEAAKDLFYEAFVRLFEGDLVNAEDGEKWLIDWVTRPRTRLPQSARENLRRAFARYSPHDRKGKSRPEGLPSATPGEKLADPVRYRVMTVTEVQELVGKGHSTIYRWLAEGKLKRADLKALPGKRSSCLILTSSVKQLFEEKLE